MTGVVSVTTLEEGDSAVHKECVQEYFVATNKQAMGCIATLLKKHKYVLRMCA